MPAEVLGVTSMLPARFEPKRKNRFVLMIEGIDAYLVKTVGAPTITTEPIEIAYMNATRYLAGKSKFGTVAITLYDPIAPSGAQQVMEWIRLHYESVSGRAGYADFYKRDCVIKLVDPVGVIISQWGLYGSLITEANFGDLAYEDGTPTEISLTIQPDNIVLQY